MGIVDDKIKDLKEREKKILKMGGEKAIAKEREKGKLTARERLDLLFDAGTFREIDMFVSHRCTNFGMEKIDIPSDGVVTGHGMVDGRPVFANLLMNYIAWQDRIGRKGKVPYHPFDSVIGIRQRDASSRRRV